MALSIKDLKRELESSKAALKAHKEGVEIHKIVIKAFEEAIKNA